MAIDKQCRYIVLTLKFDDPTEKSASEIAAIAPVDKVVCPFKRSEQTFLCPLCKLKSSVSTRAPSLYCLLALLIGLSCHTFHRPFDRLVGSTGAVAGDEREHEK